MDERTQDTAGTWIILAVVSLIAAVTLLSLVYAVRLLLHSPLH